MIKKLLVSGYRSFELNIFQENDPKIKRIKEVLKNELLFFIEEGLEWVITSGNLGVEQWVVEVVEDLKQDYPEIKVALLYPYHHFGHQWKESNQLKKEHVEQVADFCIATSQNDYFSPQQLKDHQHFLLTHTDGALLIYDEQAPGKPSFLLKAIQRYQNEKNYFYRLIDFDILQNFENYD